MSVDGYKQSISVAAGADLSALQFRAVQIDGTLATTNKNAAGILQNKPESGEHANIAFFGHLKGVAGAALAVGNDVKVSSGGFLTAVASGDSSRGKVVTAASSGSMVEFIGNFASGYTHTYSAG